MATQLLMEKIEERLIPTDDEGYKAIRLMPDGTIVRVTFSVPRSARQLRLYHAMINLVFEHQEEPRQFPTRDALRAGINIALGHSEQVHNYLTGQIYTIPKSIAFGAMDHTEFVEYFDAFKHFVLTQILPRVESRDLDQAVADMLRLPGPNQLLR